LPEQQPPSQLVEDIERRLEQIQRKVTAASEQVGLTRKIVAAGKPYWESADEIFMNGKPDAILTSGYQVLASFREQVESLEEQSSDFQGQVQSVMGSATVFANSTASTASVSGYSLGFNSEPIKQFRYVFDTHDEYGVRMSIINPALGKSFDTIKSAYFGSTKEGLRQSLFMARQTFDQLFDSLVTDDEVRQQSWWLSENSQKPEMVTRRQRMRYAAEKHVKDPAKRKVLLDGIEHMNKVYNSLQKLHSRNVLDEEKDKDVLFEMLDLLKNWVDSLKTT
jgi:hypothetical protein